MADTKITALAAIGANPINVATFPIPMVDLLDNSMAASGTTKKVTVNQILGSGGTATLASATITGDLTVSTSARFNGGALAGYLNGSLMFGSSGNIVNFFAQSNGFAFKENTGANNLLTISNAGVFGFLDGAGGTRMTLNSTGLGVGVVPAAGKGALQLSSGINFPATQVASSDANTLDDYEEGTWTPTIKGTSTAGTGTYSVQVGTYTKVGRVVYFQGRLTWSAHTGTGDMQIGGIPFTALSTANSNSTCNFGYVNNISLAASSVLTGFVFPGTNDIGLYQYTAGGGVASTVAIDTAADIMFSGFYFV